MSLTRSAGVAAIGTTFTVAHSRLAERRQTFFDRKPPSLRKNLLEFVKASALASPLPIATDRMYGAPPERSASENGISHQPHFVRIAHTKRSNDRQLVRRHTNLMRTTMSSASQGPGWWQASDGNWYPPQQQPGYAPPRPPPPPGPPGYQPAGQAAGIPAPPPGPQPWSAPAYPQYPAPGGQTYGYRAGPAAFAGGAAKLPLAAWLLFGGLALDLLSCLLPTWTVSADGETANIGNTGVDWVGQLLIDGVMVLLVWATFTRPRTQSWTLIAMTVLVGLGVVGIIGEFTFAKPSSGSPAVGLFLDTAAVSILAVGIVMAWNSRSKAQPQAGNPWG
jgi:hypothetical protein